MHKEQFTKIYNEALGCYWKFNSILEEKGIDQMKQYKFYQLRKEYELGKIRPTEDEEVDEPLPVAAGTVHNPELRRRPLKAKRMVFTSAQNNTYVHENFFKNLQKYCTENDAQLVVGTFAYNKNGFQNKTKDDLWYDPVIRPYIIDESCILTESREGFIWCGELDILPTAANPMSGFDSYTGRSSSIIPHAKVQMKSIPVMKGSYQKTIYTTGAVTKRNYIPRKAGQKADFHHVFGALVVEFDAMGYAHCRQLIADSNGTFYDLTDRYKDGKVTHGHRVEAISWGDIHAEMVDTEVAYTSWKPATDRIPMLDVLKPMFQFVHDLTDFKARNHHNRKNPHFLSEMYWQSHDNVDDGMKWSAQILKDMQRDFCKTIVVDSNHDQAFKRWLSEADVNQDPVNAELYHRANYEIYKHIRLHDDAFNVFEWAVRRHKELPTTIFLDEDDSFKVKDIEHAMHGHRGLNGARGSINSYRNLGFKLTIGHGHSPGIIDGVYQNGISCKMDMGYNKGPSSWQHAHTVTYPNGKRTIIVIKNGKFRA